MIDIDGHFTYSKVALVLNTNNIDVSLYPNPVRNEINIIASIGNFSYKIMDIYGTEILIGKSNLNTTTFDCSALAKGIYFIKIECANDIKTVKFSKE